MILEQIKELTQLKAAVAKLEAQVAAELPAALAALPEKFDYPSLKSFIKALKQAAGRKPKTRKKAKVAKVKAAKAPKAAKRKRAKITDEIRAQVKTALESGQKAGAVAKAAGISLPSVQNIKKQLGLVKVRGAAATEPTSAPAS